MVADELTEMLNSLWSLVSEVAKYVELIPSQFWAVVAGAGFSILGVALTNSASQKRLFAQFEHEIKSKRLDREMALRKDVFLAAAEAISSGIDVIGRFANFDIPNGGVTQPYLDKLPSIAKVHVIGQTPTVLAVTKFTSHLGALFVELFAQRHALMNQLDEIRMLDDQVSQFGKERDKILEMMKQCNIEGLSDQRKWAVLQQNFDLEQRRIEEFLTKRFDLAADLQPKHMDFMRQCISHSAELGAMVVPLLAAVREELELPLDMNAYGQVMTESYVAQQEAVNAFIKKLSLNSSKPSPCANTNDA